MELDPFTRFKLNEQKVHAEKLNKQLKLAQAAAKKRERLFSTFSPTKTNDIPLGFGIRDFAGSNIQVTPSTTNNPQDFSIDIEGKGASPSLLVDLLRRRISKHITPTSEEINAEDAINTLKERQRKLLNDSLIQAEREKTSLVTDAEKNTISGKLLNAGGILLSGGSQVIDAVGSLPFEGVNALQNIGISNNQRKLFASIKNKQIEQKALQIELDKLPPIEEDTPETRARRRQLLERNSALSFTKEEQALFTDGINPDSEGLLTESTFDQLQEIEVRDSFIDSFGKLSEDAGKLVNRDVSNKALGTLDTKNKEAIAEFKKGNNLKGTKLILEAFKDLALEDTEAAIELFSESLPLMGALVVSGGITMTALTAQFFDKSVKDFESENNRLPTNDEKRGIFVLGTVFATLDRVGAIGTAQAGKIGKTIFKGLEGAGLKLGSLNSFLLKPFTAGFNTTGAVALEAGTESVQNVLEQFAVKQDLSKVDLVKVITNGQLGGFGGGVFSAPSVAGAALAVPAGVAAKGVNTLAEKRDAFLKDAKDKKEGQLAADLKNNTGTSVELATRIVSSGLGDLNGDERKARLNKLSELITKARKEDPEKDLSELTSAFSGLVDSHLNTLAKEKGETVKDNLATLAEETTEENKEAKTESFNQIVSSIKDGTEIPLKQLEDTVFGSKEFDDASKEDQDTIKNNIELLTGAEEVQENILKKDSKGFTSITTHAKNLFKAIAVGDKTAALATVKELSNLRQLQQDKLKALTLAEKRFKKSKKQEDFKVNSFTGFGDKKTARFIKEFVSPDLAAIKLAEKGAIALFNDSFDGSEVAPAPLDSKVTFAGDTTENVSEDTSDVSTDTSTTETKPVTKKTAKTAKTAVTNSSKVTKGKLALNKTGKGALTKVLNTLKSLGDSKNKLPSKILEDERAAQIETLNKIIGENGTNEVSEEEFNSILENFKILRKDFLAFDTTKSGEENAKIVESKRATQAAEAKKRAAQREKDKAEQGVETKKVSETKATEVNTKAGKDSIVNEQPIADELLENTNEKEALIVKAAKALVEAVKKGTKKIIGLPVGTTVNTLFSKKAKAPVGILSTVPDFFTKIRNDTLSSSVITRILALAEEETAVLEPLQKFVSAFSNTLSKAILELDSNAVFPEQINGTRSSLERNPLLFFAKRDSKGNLSLPENLVSIMSTVGFNWLGTRSRETLTNTADDINSIIGAPIGTPISPRNLATFQNVGIVRTVLAENLGRQVVKQLGIKITDTNNSEVMAKLEMAVGLAMIKTMEDNNLVEISSVSAERMASANGIEDSETNFDPTKSTNFVRAKSTAKVIKTKKGKANKQGKPVLIKSISEIEDLLSKAPEFLESFFGITSSKVLAGLEPNTEIPKTLKGNKQKLPSKFKKVLQKMQAVKWEIKQNTHNVVNNIDRTTLLKMSGWVDLDSESFIHTDRRKQIEAVNEEIERTIDNYFLNVKHVENNGGLKSPIYLSYEVWKNFRIGIKNNTLNPQGSKIIRHLIGVRSWNTTVGVKDKSRVNFKLAVAAAFGFGIDKNSLEDSLNEFERLRKDPVIKKGIAALKVINNPKSSASKKKTAEEDLVAAVKVGGEDLHSFDGLVALEAYKVTKSFETNIGLETDGVTNGLALALMQMPAVSNSELASVGIFVNEETGLTYPEWKSKQGNQDIYQKLTSEWQRQVYLLGQGNKTIAKKITALESLIGAFVDADNQVTSLGRQMSKDPVLLTNYGAGSDSILDNLTPIIIEKIQIALEKASQAKAPSSVEAETKKIVTDIFTLAGKKIPKDLDFSDPLNLSISAKLETVLRGSILEIYGNTLKSALEKKLGFFTEFREKINNSLNIMFDIFNKKFEDRQKAEVKRLGRELSYQEISDIFDSLQKFQPIIKTPFSKGKEDGLLAVKLISERDYKRLRDASQVNYSKGQPKSAVGVISHTTYLNPGVSGLVTATHAQDGSIQTNIFEEFEALNIHDAAIYGIADASEGTKTANKSFWKVGTNYSVFQEVTNALTALVDDINSDAGAMKAATQSVRATTRAKDFPTIRNFLNEMVDFNGSVQAARANLLSEGPIGINQFALPGDSSFEANTEETVEVTESNIKEITDSVHTEQGEIAPRTELQMQNIFKGMKDARELVAWLKDNATTPARRAIAARIQELIPEGVTLNLNAKFPVLGTASFNKFSDERQFVPVSISILSIENAGRNKNGANEITWLHELLHVATVTTHQRIVERVKLTEEESEVQDNVLAIDNKLKKLIANILNSPEFNTKESLTRSDEEVARAVENMRLFKNAFKNTQEIISWGLTDPDFQRVLRQVKVTKTRSAWNSFIELMHDLLGISKDNSALTELVDLSSQLFDVAIPDGPNNHLTALEKERVALENERDEIDKQIAESINDESIDVNALEIKRNELLEQILDNLRKDDPDKVFNLSTEKEESTTFNSSNEENIDFDNFTSQFDENLTAKNSVEIFEKVKQYGNKQDSPSHTAHLRSILENIVNKVLVRMDAQDFRLKVDGDKTFGAVKGRKIFINASATSRINSHSEMSTQETHVHELLHTTMAYAIDNSFLFRQELLKIFNGVKDRITPDDFLLRDENGDVVIKNSLEQEKASATERYNYIFNNSRNIKTSDQTTKNAFLHEFVSFGLTNEVFQKKLSSLIVDSTVKVPLTAAQRINNWFINVLNWIGFKFEKLRNTETADVALRNLVEHTAHTMNKQRNSLLDKMQISQQLNDKASQLAVNNIVEPFVKWRKTKLETSTSRTGKVLNAIAVLPDTVRSKKFKKVLREFLRRLKITEDGLLLSLVREVSKTSVDGLRWHELLRKSKDIIDRARKTASEEIIEEIENTFLTGKPNSKESTAITKALLKTDLVTLIGKYKIKDILTDSSELIKAIQDTQKELDSFGPENKSYYVNQARGLGLLMASGVVGLYGLQLNAQSIATLQGTQQSLKEGSSKQAEEIIDRLASLYALQNTDTVHKDTLSTVMEREYAENGDDNGIIHLLNLHAGVKEEALNSVFKNQKGLMIKGYTHETINPNTDIKIGSKEDEAEMNRAGYVLHAVLDQDRFDRSPSRVMYVSKNNASIAYLKATASLTNKNSKGFSFLDAYESTHAMTAIDKADEARRKMNAKVDPLIAAQFKGTVALNTTDPIMLPIRNSNGKVTGYRYVLSEQFKDEVFEKDNRFDHVMGSMWGSLKDKKNSKTINKEVIDLAYEDFQNGFAEDPDAFVRIALDSEDPKFRELYKLLPKDMRRDMMDVFGSDHMFVRKEFVDIIFGYRKASIGNIFKNSKAPLAKSINRALNLGKVKQAELIWQEIVNVAKTNIVIRNPAVISANFISNLALSWVKGVPPGYLIKNQALALQALRVHRVDIRKLSALKRKVKIDKNLSNSAVTALNEQISQLENNIENNPVNELIQEGLFQAITEDVSDTRSIYNYRDKLINKSKVIKKIPKPIKAGAELAYLSEDTTIFKTMLKATQYSDFIARFALHKHNTEVKGMTKKESIQDVVDAFINYDVPTSKELQYLNDMGFFMFSKFLFRIQKVILQNFTENPARVLSLLLMQGAFGGITDILDDNLITGSITGRMGFFKGPFNSATDVQGLNILSGMFGY